MPEDAGRIAAEAERQLRVAGQPARAAAEQAYLKSSMAFAGTPVPQTRRIIRALVRAGPPLTRGSLAGLAAALWQRPIHECRMAAVVVLADHQRLLAAADGAQIETMIRQAGTWALVDGLAVWVMGPLAMREPVLGATLDRWAADPISGSGGRRCWRCWSRSGGTPASSPGSAGTPTRCWRDGSASHGSGAGELRPALRAYGRGILVRDRPAVGADPPQQAHRIAGPFGFCLPPSRALRWPRETVLGRCFVAHRSAPSCPARTAAWLCSMSRVAVTRVTGPAAASSRSCASAPACSPCPSSAR